MVSSKRRRRNLLDVSNSYFLKRFLPNGFAFGVACEDGSCRLFDVRANAQLMKYTAEGLIVPASSVAFSKSGRYTFAGYDSGICYAWDTLKGEQLYSLQGHENAISCLAVSSDGMALCTGSWDNLLRVWA